MRQEAIQPRNTKRLTTFKLATPVRVGKRTGKANKTLTSYASEIKDDVEHEHCAIAGKVKTNNALPTLT